MGENRLKPLYMNNITQLVWLIPVLPLAGVLINGLFRNYLSKALTGIIGSGMILLAFILSLLIFSGSRLADTFRRWHRTRTALTGSAGAAFVGFGVKLATAAVN